jgi:hypothetical protein
LWTCPDPEQGRQIVKNVLLKRTKQNVSVVLRVDEAIGARAWPHRLSVIFSVKIEPTIRMYQLVPEMTLTMMTLLSSPCSSGPRPAMHLHPHQLEVLLLLRSRSYTHPRAPSGAGPWVEFQPVPCRNQDKAFSVDLRQLLTFRWLTPRRCKRAA